MWLVAAIIITVIIIKTLEIRCPLGDIEDDSVQN